MANFQTQLDVTSRPVRVRYAPSPTGPQHIGGLRTALFCYLFARKYKGTFILRIEDTDQSRFVLGAEEYIRESLNWVGISIDEGPEIGGPSAPYRQSERFHAGIYKPFIDQLLASGKAYYAFDTEDELEAVRERTKAAGVTVFKYDAITRTYLKNSTSLPKDEVDKRLANGDPYVVRIKIERNEEVRLYDLIRGHVLVNTNEMDDKVLAKSDGMPTYHMANVVDDFLMEITQVIRGEEWLPSAPLHVLLYQYLGIESKMPQFAHLPLILKPDGKGKLSKRDGDKLGIPVFPLDWNHGLQDHCSGFREAGYLPGAMLNLLAFLGWHPSESEKELFSLDELIEDFSIERVSKSGAKFDPDKAKWFNQKYIQMQPIEHFVKALKKELESDDRTWSDDYLEQVAIMMKERVTFMTNLRGTDWFFFEQPPVKAGIEPYTRIKPEMIPFFTSLSQKLDTEEESSGGIEEHFNQVALDLGLKAGAHKAPFRILITGETGGPDLFPMLELIGRKEVATRLAHGLAQLN